MRMFPFLAGVHRAIQALLARDEAANVRPSLTAVANGGNRPKLNSEDHQ